MTLGEFLALCREIKGKTLRDVERETGLSNAYISQIETGKVGVISFKSAITLSRYYGISLDRMASIETPQKGQDDE